MSAVKNESASPSRSNSIPPYISDSEPESVSLSPPRDDGSRHNEREFMSGYTRSSYRDGRGYRGSSGHSRVERPGGDDDENENEGEDEDDEGLNGYGDGYGGREDDGEDDDEERDDNEEDENENEDSDQEIKNEDSSEPELELSIEIDDMQMNVPHTQQILLSDMEGSEHELDSDRNSTASEDWRHMNFTQEDEIATLTLPTKEEIAATVEEELQKQIYKSVQEEKIRQDMAAANNRPAPDPSPTIRILAIGTDMCEEFMESICPDVKLIGIGRLDGWMFCVDEKVEGVCCYRNIVPDSDLMNEEEEAEYNTVDKVVYGLIWEIHESTLYTLLEMNKKGCEPQFGMARVDVVKLECESFGRAFGMGWGLKRGLKEVGVEKDVVIFTGTPGGMGLGEGYNEGVNRGIIEGCMRGIPDEWVESDVRIWVQYPYVPVPMK
ncbi:hypothetical protein BELL_0452g00130 [Botrytis elliptica]|uniref:Uncharacterized protein n=1 Tax=Botrytis elliptica TaxID=278938 RepID=A0A4Z1JUA4_9HELO|nr:hypothetical protein EAE99_004565 [Botrytis elliptica]TGO72467.1 hypothetical protein BELL_0452g00130 [Botrytis elliptica]